MGNRQDQASTVVKTHKEDPPHLNRSNPWKAVPGFGFRYLGATKPRYARI